MGKMRKPLSALVLLALVIVLAVAALIRQTGYSVSEMDWNSDGETSVAEMWRAIDVGRRPTVQDGVECQEYFRFKDGLPVRIDCPKIGSPRNMQ